MYGGDPQQQHPRPPQHPNPHQFQHQQPIPHDFSRGPHPSLGPPPPQLMRQPSASSSTMVAPPPDFHNHHQQVGMQLPPPYPMQPSPYTMQPQYEGNADSFAAKRMRKLGQRERRTVDYTSTIVRYMQARMFQRDSKDRTTLQSNPVAAIDMLPSIACLDNPSTSFAAKFVHTSLNKNRCPINRVSWFPTGKRLVTGSQTGEFTLWNGQAFNFEMILQAHEHAVRSMVWSYNDNWMVTGDDGGAIKYWQPNMNNVKANKSAHKESIRGLSFCRTDLKFCSCSDDTTVKIWDFARCQEEKSLSGHGWDVKCVDWHPTKSLLVSGGKDNLVKLWDAKSGKELSSFHGHKNNVLCTKWNQNGNWVLTASKDQIIKLYDIRAMKELESFRGHTKDVTALAWHPFHEEYFVSGGYDGSIFHWLVGQEIPQVEVQNAHDNSVWDLAWHPTGYILCSGGNDHATKFWCRNRPGDPANDKAYSGPNQGFGEQSSAAALGGRYPGPEPATTPGPFGVGFGRNEGTIPGIGVAMPLSGQGDQKPVSMPLGPPPLPPGPHPSRFVGNQPPYQQNPPLFQQNQIPTHLPPSQFPSLPRPPQFQPLNMSPNVPPSSMPGSLPNPMGGMNQIGLPMPQGRFMGMNPMGSGPPGGNPNGLPNIPGGNQMYQPGGGFGRPQGGQMPMMPGLGPYQQQPGNPNAPGMQSSFNIPPPLPPGPPPHGQSHQ